MPPKVIPTTATTSRSVGNISIANINLQGVTVAQLQEVINTLIVNRTSLENRLNKMDIIKVKMLLVKRFRGGKFKLRGFLT